MDTTIEFVHLERPLAAPTASEEQGRRLGRLGMRIFLLALLPLGAWV